MSALIDRDDLVSSRTHRDREREKEREREFSRLPFPATQNYVSNKEKFPLKRAVALLLLLGAAWWLFIRTDTSAAGVEKEKVDSTRAAKKEKTKVTVDVVFGEAGGVTKEFDVG